MESINTRRLILASKSPRRKRLLEQVGIQIKISPSQIDEQTVAIQAPQAYVKELAFLKTQNIARCHPESWVLGADTIVVVEDQILGKPRTTTDAVDMLNALNDTEHSVYTGFCIINQKENNIVQQTIETKVRFKHLSDPEIKWYVNTGEPFGKAGAYAIQGIGAFLVKQICGSYSNVVGLPVCEIVDTLITLNIIQFKDLDTHVIH